MQRRGFLADLICQQPPFDEAGKYVTLKDGDSNVGPWIPRRKPVNVILPASFSSFVILLFNCLQKLD
jgi:hypothetical protein